MYFAQDDNPTQFHLQNQTSFKFQKITWKQCPSANKNYYYILYVSYQFFQLSI